ncbi:MAG: hypothetical protein CL676_12075 [Bdellovibrionaceae bacterium]|nr:hypothetical protein [Pseudobdellovibrionaceae bacterium]|tara:strand:+ start:2295 stop:2570 length:276 start_codon:yes stop_codon:yes gene_type:complete
MRVVVFIGLLAFGLNAFAKIDFVEYVKRNRNVLKKSVELPKTTAFKEINPYRGVASMTDALPEGESKESTSPSSSENSASSSEDSDSGPNK